MIRFHRQSLLAIAAAGVVMACVSIYQFGTTQNRAAAQLPPAENVPSEPLHHRTRSACPPLTCDHDRLEQITRRTVQNLVHLSDREIDEIKLLISELSAIADTANSMHFDMYVREFRPLALHDGLFHPARNHGRPYRSNEDRKSEFEARQRLDQSPALNRLVELGPRALPLLLASLDDATPTRIEFTRRGFCHTILDCNIWVNPHNPFELHDSERPASSPTVEIDSYTVTVGDLCFLTIGQIVGREYHIFTDVPSATVKVCSPTRDARLCEQVRRTWSSSEPAQKLLDSLLSDLSIPPKDEIRTLCSLRLPFEAATRLLYYFPSESLSLIIDRLDHLDVTSPSSGYEAGEFVKAVSWSNEPGIRASLLRILDRSSNPIAAAAASRAATPDQTARVLQKLGRMIEERSADGADAKGECYPLLVALYAVKAVGIVMLALALRSVSVSESR